MFSMNFRGFEDSTPSCCSPNGKPLDPALLHPDCRPIYIYNDDRSSFFFFVIIIIILQPIWSSTIRKSKSNMIYIYGFFPPLPLSHVCLQNSIGQNFEVTTVAGFTRDTMSLAWISSGPLLLLGRTVHLVQEIRWEQALDLLLLVVQVNQITSYLDGSNLYGSSPGQQHRLRLLSKGKLRYTDLHIRLQWSRWSFLWWRWQEMRGDDDGQARPQWW